MTNECALRRSEDFGPELRPAPLRETAIRVKYTSPVMRTYGSVHALTLGGAGSFADMAGLNMMMASDPRLKERIVRVGTHPLGIGLYLFDYRPAYREAYGGGRQLGVMANEVEKVMPRAVCRNAAGFRMVNYAMLGVQRRAP